MRSAPDLASLPTSGEKQLSSCPDVCVGALVTAAGRLAAEGPAPLLPDAAGGLSAEAGVLALRSAAGVLADGGLMPLLDAAEVLSPVSGMRAA